MRIDNLLWAAVISAAFFGCNDSPSCEEDNIGVLTFENTNTSDDLAVFIDPSEGDFNSEADLTVSSNSTASIDVSLGIRRLVVLQRTSTCVSTNNDGSCNRTQVNVTTLIDEDTEIILCDEQLFVF
ncbi:MAG: hypothetical protein AAF600_12830 [Bacteroidota bacterium]